MQRDIEPQISEVDRQKNKSYRIAKRYLADDLVYAGQ